MTVPTIIVTLPDLYAQIEAQAQDMARTVDDLVAQTLMRALPPTTDAALPPTVRAELRAMEELTDDALWAIAGSTANSDRQALYDLLIERQNSHVLTPDGRHMLAQMREEADALMLRKAQAYSLLHARGHAIPTLDELRAQTA